MGKTPTILSLGKTSMKRTNSSIIKEIQTYPWVKSVTVQKHPYSAILVELHYRIYFFQFRVSERVFINFNDALGFCQKENLWFSPGNYLERQENKAKLQTEREAKKRQQRRNMLARRRYARSKQTQTAGCKYLISDSDRKKIERILGLIKPTTDKNKVPSED